MSSVVGEGVLLIYGCCEERILVMSCLSCGL